MIASWMLFALLVSALVAAAAQILEEVCRLSGSPVRFVWIGALLAMLSLVALAPLRTDAPEPRSITAVLTVPLASDTGSAAETDRWACSQRR